MHPEYALERVRKGFFMYITDHMTLSFFYYIVIDYLKYRYKKAQLPPEKR